MSPTLTPTNLSGVNYDVDLLTFRQYRPGFIWGEAVWGQSVWGTDTLLGDLSKTFTSLTISEPVAVEQGAFLHAEPVTAQLTTTDPAHKLLKGAPLEVLYAGQRLFYGRVARVSSKETVDVGRPDRRGNTARRTHRVTLTLQQGTEYMANAPTPARSFTNETLAVRVQALLGTTTTGANVSSHDDVDSGVMGNVGGWVTDREKVLPADDKGSLLDTLRGMLGRINKVLRPDFGLGSAAADSISQCAAGSTVAATLRFTDSPATYGVPRISYSELSEDENPEWFPTGIAVTVAGVRYGPYDIGQQQRVIEYDLGTMDFAGRDPQVARNFAATVPLKRSAAAFVSKLTLPAQPNLYQPNFPVPRLAVLRRDGVETTIAVLSKQHTITPRGWIIELDCGPAHLLTRQSDLDPSPVTGLLVDQPGGAGTGVRVRWNSPKYIPLDVPIYRTIYWQVFAAAGGEVSSDAGHNFVAHEWVTPEFELPGTPQSFTIDLVAGGLTPGLKFFYVQYTSDPVPASGVFNDSYRQGQARFAGYTVI